ncbi:MAG: hypothetical protein FGM22_07350 [Burkholderiaceae bacterium]|nr:hypothetical protein [Burkholderiaceae bacterium]
MGKKLSPDVPQAVCDLANAIHWEMIDEAEQRRGIAELETVIAKHLPMKKQGQQYPGAGGQRIRNAVPQWVLDKLSLYDYAKAPKNTLAQNVMKSLALNQLRKRGVPLITQG